MNVFGMLARPLRARREEREARERASEIITLCGLERLAERRCADLPLESCAGSIWPVRGQRSQTAAT
ncbi:MAG: hypothetical protein WDN50_09925 [Bradyrhizobium sp.]